MLIHVMIETEQVPTEWKGRRLVTAWKSKGAMEDCDSHRRLLLSDHACKAFTSLLKDELEAPYANHIPDAQHGCVKGRSTAFVCHTSRSFIDYCRMAGLSMFLLFLDLSKAFDFIVREFAIGAQQGTGGSAKNAADAVAKLGLDQEEAHQLALEIQQHGSYLKMCGADPKVAKLVAALHTGS